MLRASFLEYPSDPCTWNLDTQYFLGDSILVAPVFTDDGSVQFYVPEGDWVGLQDRKVRTGPGYVEEVHDFFSIPALLRPGSAIPVGQENGSVLYDWSRNFNLLINYKSDMDQIVEIPSLEKLGDIAASLKVKGSQGKCEIEVLSGATTGDWTVEVVNGTPSKGVVDDEALELANGKLSVKQTGKKIVLEL